MSDKQNVSKYAGHLSLGMNMVCGMVVFTLLGYWIDQKLGKDQVFTLIGIFFGLFYCGYEVFKLVKANNND